MKRVLALSAILAAGVFAAGCSGSSPSVTAPNATRDAMSSRSSNDAITAALASCGLFPGDAGVSLGPNARLSLISEPHGEPTDVGAVTTRCTLVALGLPTTDAPVFDTTMSTGGYQALQWGRWSVSEHVTDTLHFEVDVFSTGE